MLSCLFSYIKMMYTTKELLSFSMKERESLVKKEER